MFTSLRSCFLAASVGLLFVSLNAGAAESPKNKSRAEDPVKQCQAGCKVHNDNEAYEGCMLKCKETHKSTAPVSPAPRR
jgi:hypothetical protein